MGRAWWSVVCLAALAGCGGGSSQLGSGVYRQITNGAFDVKRRL